MPECPACQSTHTVKNGKAKNGTQTYLCKGCGRRFHPEARPIAHSEATRQQILDAVHERMSSERSTARLWCSPQHRDPVDKKGAREVMQTGTVCMTPPEEVVIELDEMWTFVAKKKQTRWIWIALERSTRRVLAWVLGDRSEQTAFKLWERLPLSLEQRLKGTFCTDLWRAYDEPLLGVKRLTRKGETNHVERLNCTLRQRLGRLVRKSLSFSKTDEMLEASLTLAFHRYNLSR
ncbi:IS1 family transposase [Deinococcus sp. SL84]|nr:IS1 family transposase [Deinococcus sp. SL84]MCY1704327.1 IS1 family transposase [Deinococcus sp. SL84]